MSKFRRIASFLTVSQLHFHMSQELASRSLGSLCLGIVDVTGDVRGDRHVSQHECGLGVGVAPQLKPKVCLLCILSVQMLPACLLLNCPDAKMKT